METQPGIPEPQMTPPEQPAGWQPPAVPPRKKTGLYILIGAAALVLLLAIGGLIAIWQLGLLPFLTGRLGAPEIMPQSVGFYGAMRIDIQTTAGYKHLYDVYGQIPEAQKGLDEALAESGISFEQDIRPWLGNEVALGVTNAAALGPSTLLEGISAQENPEAGFVLAVATRDTKASDAFLAKLRGQFEEQGYTVEKKEFGGVSFSVRQPRSRYESPAFFGTLQGFVVVASDEKIVQGMVDVTQGRAAPLARSQAFQEVMAALPGNAAAYFVLTDLQGFLAEEANGLLSYLSGTASWQMEAYKSAGAAVILGEEGVQVEIVATFDPSALSAEELAGLQGARGQDRILRRVPNGAVFFSSGNDLAGRWRTFIAGLKANTDAQEQLDELGDELGLPIDEELLSWADGEYVLALVESQDALLGPRLGAFALLEVSDRAQAENLVDRLTEALSEIQGAGFQPGEVGGVTLQLLRVPDMDKIILGYGFDGAGNFLLGFSEDALRDGLGQDIQSITEDGYFQRVQAHLPAGGGYTYLNVERFWQMIYDSMDTYAQEEFDTSTRPYLEPIKAAGWAGHPVDTGRGIQRNTLFIYIP